MRYYIVYLDFDTDIIRIDSFDNQEAFDTAVYKADIAQREQAYPEVRDWASFSTWQEPA
jgi:hypothetical protein